MVGVRKRTAPAWQGVVIPFGRERSGDDAGSHIRAVDLPPGVAARSVWIGDDHTLLISRLVPRAAWAECDRHILRERAVLAHDDSWDSVSCTRDNCARARAWLTESGCTAEASGL